MNNKPLLPYVQEIEKDKIFKVNTTGIYRIESNIDVSILMHIILDVKTKKSEPTTYFNIQSQNIFPKGKGNNVFSLLKGKYLQFFYPNKDFQITLEYLAEEMADVKGEF